MSDDIASLVIEVKSDGVDKAKRSLADLSQQGSKTESSVKNLGNESKKAGESVSSIAIGSDKASTSLASVASAAKYAAIGVAGVAAGVIGLGSALTKTFIDFEKLNNTLKFATGSASAAAKEMEYIKKTTNSLGLELLSTATAYTKFSAATKGTALEGQKTRDVFEAVAKASTVMGLSADESAGALLAISQMMSKGTVSAEELRGQLGERLPGAFQIAAKSIGVTTQELGKMLEQGQIVASDFLPKFAAELTKSLGDSPQSAAGSAQAQLNKLSNAWTEFKKNIAESGVVTITIKGVEALTYVINGVNKLTSGNTSQQTESYKKARLATLIDVKERGSAPDFMRARNDAEIKKLRVELGLLTNAQVQPSNGNNSQPNFAPNFGITEAQNINDIHRQQDQASRIRDAAQKEANDRAKKLREEALKSIQDSINEEQDLVEGRYQFEQMWQGILDKQKSDAYKIELERVDKLQKIANENFNEAQRNVDNAEKERLREFEKSTDKINDIFREGFANMVRGGKGSWKAFTKELVVNFKTTVADAIYNMLAKPFVVKILASIAGFGVSGAAGAATFQDGIMQEVTNGGSIFGTISNGLSSLNTNVVGSIEKLGAFLSNGNGGLADTIGGYLGQNASTIAGALSFAPAVLSLIKGDIKSAAFQGGGAAIGLALGGPVGGAIGSFLGGALGGLFGGSSLPPRYTSTAHSSLVDGSFSGTTGVSKGKSAQSGDALTSLNETFSRNLSAILSGFGLNSNVYTYGALSKQTNSRGIFTASFDGASVNADTQKIKKGSVQQAFDALANIVLGKTLVEAIQKSKLTDGIKSLFNGLTDKTQIATMINASLTLADAQKQLSDRFGLTTDQAAKVSVATGLAGDELAKFVVTLSQSANAFKTVGDVLTEAKAQLSEGLGGSVPASLKDFDNVLKGIDKTTQAGIESFTEMFSLRNQFAAFTTSLDQLKGGVNGALYSIVSDTEKQAMLNADLAKVFSELGRDVPSSVEELIALGKTIDFTTKEGLDLAAVFPGLVTAFVQTKGAVDDLMNSLREIDNFKTLVDFNRYQGLAKNYGTSFANSYIDGQSQNVNASNSINTPVTTVDIQPSNNTTISTSDPNLLEAIMLLNAKIDALQLEASKSATHSKRAADVLVNVSPNGNALQTEAVV